MNISRHPLFDLLLDLDQKGVYYTLGRHRLDSILVTATLVGSRIEIDVFDDGHMEVAVFEGTEAIVGGRELVSRLLEG